MNLVRAGAYLMSSLLRPSYLGGVPRKYKFVGMQPTVRSPFLSHTLDSEKLTLLSHFCVMYSERTLMK